MGPELVFVGRTEVVYKGRRYLFFGGNDYHRFASDPEVVEAFVACAREYGLSPAGSRGTTANHPLYGQLERALAGFLGAEAALLCASGYLANLLLLQGVAPEFDRILLDEACHSSLQESARICGLPITRFRTRSAADLQRHLASAECSGRRCLIATDGVFPSTGHLAPLAEYAELARACDAAMLVDDAHGFGVLGTTGQGSVQEAGVARVRVFRTGTMSKRLGGYGGVVLGDAATIQSVRSCSTAFVGATPPPLPSVAAGIRAIRILSAEPRRMRLLRERSLSSKASLRDAGFAMVDGPAPILSVTLGDAERNAALARRLRAAGIYPPFIQYPGCPPGGHFRFTLSSAHRAGDLEKLLSVLVGRIRAV